MVPDSVTFTNFEVSDPRLVLDTIVENKPAFWPIGWSLVFEDPNKEYGAINLAKWMRENCRYRWDEAWDENGNRIFAFESDEEAVLFRLSF